MKKRLAIFVMLLLLMTMVACGTEGNDSKTSDVAAGKTDQSQIESKDSTATNSSATEASTDATGTTAASQEAPETSESSSDQPTVAFEELTVVDNDQCLVKITGFDLTAPSQFDEAMDDLLREGCKYFVFDVRYNPGGDLLSIRAVLSRILNEGDVIIRTRDHDKNEEITRVETYQDIYCGVDKDDIAKYREAVLGKSAVLVNGSTASAAELFTSALKDYGISKIIGEKTYGKGSMQSIIPLKKYSGAVKLTTKMYFPPLSDGYNGIGITPDETVPLDDSLKNRNIYDITDAEDNQLQAALDSLKKQ